MTTRTVPPTRRSTSASLTSQVCSAFHQRRMTSSLVQASNTASAGAWKVRSICSVWVSVTQRPRVGVAGAPSSTRAREAAPRRRRRRRAGPPPPARPRRERSRVRSLRGPDALDLLEMLRVGFLAVLVVAVPPRVARGLWVALRRVLPLLLAAQRGHVHVGPDAAQRLVAAAVDEVGPEDPVFVVA